MLVFSLVLMVYFSSYTRYPFYIAQTLNIPIEPLIWLRYSAWIPLYPVGILSEGVDYVLFAKANLLCTANANFISKYYYHTHNTISVHFISTILVFILSFLSFCNSFTFFTLHFSPHTTAWCSKVYSMFYSMHWLFAAK